MSAQEAKVALVTGASRGIGQAIAHTLAANGYTVVGTATTESGAEKITAAFAEKGLAGHGFCLNVTNAESIAGALSFIKDAYGLPAVLVNNAGITRDNLMMRMKDDEWDQVIETNLSSVFRLSKACIRGMVKSRWGRIINIGSVVGQMGNPGQSNYVAAKAGVEGFSRALAKEIAGRGVTVNTVAPGFIDTDMTKALPEAQRESLLTAIPAGRLGSPADIAAAVLFLASDAASYITGDTLHVNGGMYMG